ncbi:MAG: LemA family protein [Chitinophagaceae bacterium]|nr:LemA family protein [Chitinophagaceae bacterium]
MNKRYSGFIVAAILIILVIFSVVTYNGLVKKEEKVKLQWSEMQNAYQRRIDLIPNLVNVVKGQTDFEKTTLEKITAARAKAAAINYSATEFSPEKLKLNEDAQNELAGATNNLIAVIEKYPTLTGTEAFRGLQTQLEGTERRIKFARKDFNEAVAVYNSAARSFPTSIVAGLLGFKSKEGFQSETGTDKATEIKF